MEHHRDALCLHLIERLHVIATLKLDNCREHTSHNRWTLGQRTKHQTPRMNAKKAYKGADDVLNEGHLEGEFGARMIQAVSVGSPI